MRQIYRTPRRTLPQLEKYNFSGQRKTHWPGRCNRIKRTTFLPSRGHFRKQTCDTIPLGRYGLRHSSWGHNSKWAFFELWHCSSMGGLYVHVSINSKLRIAVLVPAHAQRTSRTQCVRKFVINFDIKLQMPSAMLQPSDRTFRSFNNDVLHYKEYPDKGSIVWYHLSSRACYHSVLLLLSSSLLSKHITNKIQKTKTLLFYMGEKLGHSYWGT
jgi:hypothetical protein